MAGEQVTQADYARRRRVSRVAVYKRTTTAGGPIPVHGPKKLIDVAEADGLWHPTMSPRNAARVEPAPGGGVSGTELARARAAAVIVDVQTKRLALEQRRGALISRDRAVLKAFAFARLLRDSWLNWPARVGPQMAADLDVDATTLTVMLEAHVRQQLADLARERPEF